MIGGIEMKRLYKRVARMMCVVMLLSCVVPFTKVEAKSLTDNLVKVVISDTEEKMIIALIDETLAAEYINAITADEAFINSEIMKTNINMRLPEGEIMSQRYLGAYAIQEMVDRNAGAGSYARIISNPITDLTVSRILAVCNCPNVFTFVAAVISWAAGDLMSRQQSWWEQSLIDIMAGRISYVRITHIRNTTSDYPAAYLIIERI